jgi:hypothetical protein
MKKSNTGELLSSPELQGYSVCACAFAERERENYIPPKIESISKEYDTHSSCNDN